MQADLRGLRILVTRPAHQAVGLAALIEACGGVAVRVPVIEIREVSGPEPARAFIAALGEYDMLVFVSVNAVSRFLALLPSKQTWASALVVAAVGAGTARALEGRGIEHVLRPLEVFDSEALLALSEFSRGSMAGRRVAVIKGEGGRGALIDALRDRGARVDGVDVYRRARPGPQGSRKLREALARVDVTTVTSGAGLDNLFAMAGRAGGKRLRALPMVVVSERIAVLAREHGVTRVVVAAGAADAALVEALAGV